MAKIRASLGGSGGGDDPNIVVAYENGEYKNGFAQSSFGFYSVTHSATSIDSSTTTGSGIYCQTDYSSQYASVGFVFEIVAIVSASSTDQFGTCTTTATLPSIVSGGTGRDSDFTPYRATFNNTKNAFEIPLKSSKGFFFGYSGIRFNIKKIYFNKS